MKTFYIYVNERNESGIAAFDLHSLVYSMDEAHTIIRLWLDNNYLGKWDFDGRQYTHVDSHVGDNVLAMITKEDYYKYMFGLFTQKDKDKS